jgi:hypothetical protein
MTPAAQSESQTSERAATFARRVFLVAAVYGFVALIPQYFMEGKSGRDFPPPITHPEYYYGFIGVALAWQVLFLVIAGDPIRYRVAIVPATLEKLSFGGAAVVLYVQGRLAALMFGAGIVDLLFALLFVAAFRSTMAAAAAPARGATAETTSPAS